MENDSDYPEVRQQRFMGYLIVSGITLMLLIIGTILVIMIQQKHQLENYNSIQNAGHPGQVFNDAHLSTNTDNSTNSGFSFSSSDSFGTNSPTRN